jgi:hypothetical protein
MIKIMGYIDFEQQSRINNLKKEIEEAYEKINIAERKLKSMGVDTISLQIKL